MSSSIVDRNGGVISASPTVSRNVGLSSSAAVKGPVAALSLVPLVLSGEQTVDGVACVTGYRVAAGGQVDTTAIGIYIVSTGAWQRAPDFNRNDDVVDGGLFVATDGTANSGIWAIVCATSPAIIGTTAMSFERFELAAGYVTGGQVAALITAALTAYLTIVSAGVTYAPLASPALTGNPSAPTPAAADNDTSIATTAYVTGELAQLRNTQAIFLNGEFGAL